MTTPLAERAAVAWRAELDGLSSRLAAANQEKLRLFVSLLSSVLGEVVDPDTLETPKMELSGVLLRLYPEKRGQEYHDVLWAEELCPKCRALLYQGPIRSLAAFGDLLERKAAHQCRPLLPAATKSGWWSRLLGRLGCEYCE